jgi:hypothetical protein
MAEHDYVIANQNGANTRSDLNNALAAIVSNNSKATAPTTTYAFMWWADTANDILKQRNAADSAWISILTLSTGAPLATIANFTSTGIDDNATSTAITITSDGRGLSQFTAKAWVNFNGTGTVAIRDSHNVSSISDNANGDYSIYFSNSMSNTNYSFTGFSGNNTTGDSYSYMLGGQPLYYTGELRFKTGYYNSTSSDWTKYDSKYINIQVFGD